VKDLVEARVPLSDPNYPQFVTQVFKTWRSLTFAEKRPYYLKAFTKQQLCEIEKTTWVPPVLEQKASEVKDEPPTSEVVQPSKKESASSNDKEAHAH